MYMYMYSKVPLKVYFVFFPNFGRIKHCVVSCERYKVISTLALSNISHYPVSATQGSLDSLDDIENNSQSL